MDAEYWQEMLGAPAEEKSLKYGPELLNAVNEGNLEAAFELWNSYMREPYREETVRKVFPDAYIAVDCKGMKGKDVWAVACGEKEGVGHWSERQMVDVPTPVSRLVTQELWQYIKRHPYSVTEQILEQISSVVSRRVVAEVLMIQAMESGDLAKAESYTKMFDGRSVERLDTMRLILKHHAVKGDEPAFKQHLQKCKPKTKPGKIEELTRKLSAQITRSEGIEEGKAAFERGGHDGSTAIVSFAISQNDLSIPELIDLIEDELADNPAMACHFYQQIVRSERTEGRPLELLLEKNESHIDRIDSKLKANGAPWRERTIAIWQLASTLIKVGRLDDARQLAKRLRSGNSTRTQLEVMIEIASGNPEYAEGTVTRGLGDRDWQVRLTAIEGPEVTNKDLDKALKDKHVRVREFAARHPVLTTAQIKRALQDREAGVRRAAATHTAISKECLDQALTDPEWQVRSGAATNPNCSETQIGQALSDSLWRVRASAAANPKCSETQIAQALADDVEEVRSAAVREDR